MPPRMGQNIALGVLSTVPMAIGSYGTAVQMAGKLTDQQAVLLNCGTYAVASFAILLARLAKRGNADVDQKTWRAGIELGLWIFAGATLQAFGLQRTSASRAGFLVQLSTVIVPAMESVIQRRAPPVNIIVACILSLAGAALLLSSSDASSDTLVGDVFVTLSAFMYSAHILRLSEYAGSHDTLMLATAKSATQLATSCSVWLFGCMWVKEATTEVSLSWQIVLYTGLVTCAYPMWAQAFGQRNVKASQASVIYALAPVWSALFAMVFLGQGLSLQGVAGATLLMASCLLSVCVGTSNGRKLSTRCVALQPNNSEMDP
eukprot:TRINITY_DN111939_c0_g1_i1.p1 TRINITY_DN111939_c0_g1~~TRINITY_DN111939_c0_g1_i1.p1  ORF type:complete len:338 (-),score=24.22 TRINITY_DN111939_c0_g1_i1:395-1348(-)